MGAIPSSQPRPPVPGIYFAFSPVYFSPKARINTTLPQRTSLRKFLEATCPALWTDYQPPWWLFGSGHIQTIYAAIANSDHIERVVYERKYLRLVDGGTLGLDFAPDSPCDINDDTPMVVVLHGLTGGSQESYVHSILTPLCRSRSQGGLGYRAVVLNSRGCGGVPITSPRFYTAGHTDDLRQALIYIASLCPHAPLLGLGFSMGGNILTRYLAEEGTESRLSAACTLACPWNLARNNELLNKGFLRRYLYARSLGTSVIRLLQTHVGSFTRFSHSPVTKALLSTLRLKNPTMEEFDNSFTRIIGGDPPLFPVSTAAEYYLWASSHTKLCDIAVPYLSINAADDPIVQEIPTDCGGNGWVAMVVTAHGGHLGWFERANRIGGVDRWIRKPVLEFLSAVSELLVHVNRGRVVYEDAGFLREIGNDHLGCRVIGEHEL
ncbi:hypothetical protein Hypma_005045 [Hypsizygus marmoreus]|uniref:AB hydrolase-1 domain-containing protein n=1 Tax=Hypsizygus marmoreus TaxID=39966 RepID=A0A369K560_HYPMA|nr:hypothetical protein Hypma_005045 [Hypsizygus marmoreus]